MMEQTQYKTVNSILFSTSSTTPPHTIERTWGVYRVATELRNQGLSCKVISYLNHFSQDEVDTILSTYIGDNTVVVGFSVNFWDWYPDAKINPSIKVINYIIDYVTINYPKVKLIAGGGSILHFSEDKLNKIHAMFKGFSEHSLVKYITACKNKTTIPLPNAYIKKTISLYNDTNDKSFDFNNSFTSYLPGDISYYDIPNIEVGRGCIFKCAFCGFLLNGKTKLDYIKEIEVLREELINNYTQYGIQHYMLSDDTFNDSTYKIQLLHELFTSLPFKIKFWCYLRLDLLNAHPEQIPLLKEMGLCYAFFGVESFNKKTVSVVGKGMDPEKSKQLLYDLKTKYWGNAVRITASFIIGLPYETEESYNSFKDWIEDPNNLVDNIIAAPLKISNPKKNANSSHSEPWTDSIFSKDAEKYGFSWKNDSSNHWDNSNPGPIKSYHEAESFFINEVSPRITHSNKYINFGMMYMKVFTLSQLIGDNLSIDELALMSPDEFVNYTTYLFDEKKADYLYLRAYRDGILELCK